MDDLSLIEEKARAWTEQADDLDSLAKAASILHGVDEQRKMRAELADSQSRSQNDRAERKQNAMRFWTAALLPTMAILVTAGTLWYQIHEGQATARSQEDSQWRSAIEKIAPDSQTAAVGILEMNSFFASDYAKQARPVAASLLVKVEDPNIFDVVFFDLVHDTTPQNEPDLIALARALTERLREDQKKCIMARGPDRAPADPSLAHFLNAPQDFCDDESDLGRIDADMRKLDSVSQGLIALWKNAHPKMGPSGEDLEAIAFLNGNYGGLDFRQASLSGTGFYGECHLDGALFDNHPATLNHCENQDSKNVVAAVGAVK